MDCLLTNKAYSQGLRCRAEIDELLARKEDGIATVKVSHILERGMRGVPTLATNVSTVDRRRGMIFRGYPVYRLRHMPFLDALWLGLAGEMPNAHERALLVDMLQARSAVPDAVAAYAATAVAADPLVALSHCVSMLRHPSRAGDMFFTNLLPTREMAAEAISEILGLVAAMPRLVAELSARMDGRKTAFRADWSRGWGWNLASAVGIDQEAYGSLLEQHAIAHVDQGKGNPSSTVSHIIATTGSDAPLALAGALLTLSGPSHAYAGIGVVSMIEDILASDPHGGDATVKAYIRKRLDSGQKIFGIGQAVMKNVDTRYLILREAGEKLFRDHPKVAVADAIIRCFRAVADEGAARTIEPNPNVNLASAPILHWGLGIDRRLLPLFFAVPRSIGLLSQFFESLFFPRSVYRPTSLDLSEIRARLDEAA